MKNKRWDEVGSKFSHLISAHPCFNEKAHFTVARIHLPVAPKCNIQCKFCSRTMDKCEHRPGAYTQLQSPQQALEHLREELAKRDNLKVVGIAGPAEPLFNKETFETFELVSKEFPDLHKCIATNGLLLPEKIDRLHELGVGSITVTVNGIDPAVVAQVVSWVYYDNTLYKGVDGAEILVRHQLEGIERARDYGIPVKINTVLIPQINAGEIEAIAKSVSERGAWIMNIIPLIPLHDFKDMAPPECDDLKKARATAEKYLKQFHLCRQCRADAVGVPGDEPQGPKRPASEYYHG